MLSRDGIYERRDGRYERHVERRIAAGNRESGTLAALQRR